MCRAVPILMSENGQTGLAIWPRVEGMDLDPTLFYQALLARDRRFDGWFFVGVTSTGIYCRPVCAVRTPQERNCRFFEHQSAAEKAGFRPCLRCRPELAPGLGVLDVSQRLAHAAAALIDEGFLATADLAMLAQRVGVSERHLRRIFAAEFGVTPVEYAQTQRLLLAKRLLTDTRMDIGEIAHAAGFGSVRRFNALFLSRYRLAPGRLRKGLAKKTPGRAASAPVSVSVSTSAAVAWTRAAAAAPAGHSNADPIRTDLAAAEVPSVDDTLRFELAYRPPFAWNAVLGFLAFRQIEGVESVEAGVYRRAVRFDGPHALRTGWIAVRDLPQRLAVEVVMSASLATVVPAVLGGVRRMFDLNCRPDIVDAHLGELAADLPGMRVPGAFDGFEIAVRAVIGQQISVPHARKILAKLVDALGTALEPDAGCDGLRCTFPTAEQLASAGPERLREVGGLTQARAQTLHALAVEVASGRLRLAPLEPLEATLEGLLAIRGIGDWTAQYVAMRALSWPNAFPAGDLILRQQLGVETAAQTTAIAAQWAPWRAYATVHLWRHHQKAKLDAAEAVALSRAKVNINTKIKGLTATASRKPEAGVGASIKPTVKKRMANG